MTVKRSLWFVMLVVMGLLALPSLGQAGDPNLVAYWALDEGTGTVASDSVGGNDGTIHNADWTTG